MRVVTIIRILIALLIFVAGIALMKYLGSKAVDPPTKEFSPGVQYVKVAEVIYTDVATEVIAGGRVLSGQSVALTAEVQGRIKNGDVPLKTGQSFNKGQLLYKIDDLEAGYNLSAQKSQFLNALAAIMPDIKIDYPDENEVWQAYFINLDVTKTIDNLPKVTDVSFKTFIANRGILNQYYAIRAGEERLSKYRFYAPWDGAFTKVQMEAGATANPGSMIATIIKTDILEVEVHIAADEIKWIKRGVTATATNNNGDVINGKVIRISDYLDPTTQSIGVYIQLETDNLNLYEGMYLDVIIPGTVVKLALEIPRKALLTRSKVYLVKKGKLIISDIELVKNNRETAIIKGLKQGEKVVIEPLVNAKEGLSVEPIMDKEN